jgi:hypothetical protein
VLQVRIIIVGLICASPAILLADGLIVQGIVAGIVSVALLIVAGSLRPGETEFLVPIIRPLALIAAIPALWMLIQALPLRIFANPIWASAQNAIGHRLAGTISIDSGNSVIALGQYLCLIAVAFLSAAVAVDRHRAMWILYALTAAGASIALIMLAQELFFPGITIDALIREQSINCVSIGAIVAGAAYLHATERYESHHSNSQRSEPFLLRFSFVLSTAALAICVTALVLCATYWAIFATGCGVAALACVLFIRRFAGGPGSAMAFAAASLVATMLVLALHPPKDVRSIPLILAPASTPLAALSAQVLEDAPLVGTGAGTFADVAPIYREMNDTPPGAEPATTAAAFGIELGKPMLWLITVLTVVYILVLLRATLRRRRDFFYPAMAGSCLVTLLLLAFSNAGLLGTAPSLMAAATLGIGIAQSKSRTAHI